MHRILKAVAIVTALPALITVTACSGSGAGYKYEPAEPLLSEPPTESYPEPVEEAPNWRAAQQQFEVYSGWECYLDPTMNYDWHDDVLCTDGYSFDRPYLLEWMDFVTEGDLLNEAQNYENFLNSQ